VHSLSQVDRMSYGKIFDRKLKVWVEAPSEKNQTREVAQLSGTVVCTMVVTVCESRKLPGLRDEGD